MISKALTIPVCIALALAVAVILMTSVPAHASHPIGATYVCKTIEAADRTVAYVVAEEYDELMKRTMKDDAFECYKLQRMVPFRCTSVVREYVEANGKAKSVLYCKSPRGNDAYIFGPTDLMLSAIHQYTAE
jgi:hypothetical protein